MGRSGRVRGCPLRGSADQRTAHNRTPLFTCSQLAIAESTGNQGLQGQILLGKGFALMQPAMQHQQDEFIQKEASKRTELAIDADAGLACLRQALAIAEAAGQFVVPCYIRGLYRQLVCSRAWIGVRLSCPCESRLRVPCQLPDPFTFRLLCCAAGYVCAATAAPRRWLSSSGSSRTEDIFPYRRVYLLLSQ